MTMLFAVAVFILSYIVIIVTSAQLLVEARKSAARHGDTVKWEGVITVLLTVAVLLVSQLPYLILIVGLMVNSYWDYGIDLKLLQAIVHITSLNIMSNFFVYSLTVRSFRNFLKIKITQHICFLRQGERLHPRQSPLPRNRTPDPQRQSSHLRRSTRPVPGTSDIQRQRLHQREQPLPQ